MPHPKTQTNESRYPSPVRIALLALTLLVFGCAPSAPPHWVEGGAPLVIPAAHWNRGEATAIDVRPNGEVLEDGHLVFTIDRVGRVVDSDNEPVAMLFPDGRVVGTDDRLLGQVGVSNASPPGSGTAWLSVAPNGEVIYFDADGSRAPGGVWSGCNGPALRTCTFLTHIVALRSYVRRESGIAIGVGVGVGVGVGY